jgi:hypothetical protein
MEKLIVNKLEKEVEIILLDKKINIKSSEPFSTLSYDFAIWLVFLYASRNKIDLKIDYPVTSDLFFNIKILQQYLKKYYNLEFIKIDAINIIEPKFSNSNIIMPFSGGVDACFSLLYNHYELNRYIKSVIIIKGFDVYDDVEFNMLFKRCVNILDITKTKPIIISTNFKKIFKKINWRFQHVFVLAGLMHLFDNQFNYGLMSGAGDANIFSISDCFKFNYLNERLFYLFSSNNMRIDAFEGSNYNKIQKIDFISKNKTIQKNLRVCWVKKRHDNCGKCNKCVLTQLGFLASIGFIPSCFSKQMDKVDLDKFLNDVYDSKNNDIFYRHNIKEIFDISQINKMSHPFLEQLIPFLQKSVKVRD